MKAKHGKLKSLPRHRRNTRLRDGVAASVLTVLLTTTPPVVGTGPQLAVADMTGEIPIVREPLLSRSDMREPLYFRDETREEFVVPEPEPVPEPAPEPEPEPAPEPEPTVEPEPEPEPVVEVVEAVVSSARDAVIAFARAQIGDPYVYGGNGPDSWDCSGLTQAAFASVGISLPRVSNDQHGAGESTSISNLIPGDLVAWDGHVAIYAGDWTIIEAAKPGTNVRERALSDNWFDNGAWGVHIDY